MSGILDGLGGNLEELGARFGVSPDQIRSVTETIGANLQGGAGQTQAIADAAGEHGLTLEKLQGVLAELGGTGALEKLGLDPNGDLLGQVTGFLDKDGDGSAIDDLTDLAKGFFGGKS
ncbi:hypothetical protein [Sphingomonas colocasiae]|uniref:DUF937 domain-containing protein n=1 Tax=Sphingomonas colocasiae TaxID=1848973 RepID=A0ABS7PLG9_9SPHN|nr:hypothetical protein [Sphingomonas colocasiae]MBY8821312.1 hypothetical protein [Sphingomonas colocasiae]